MLTCHQTRVIPGREAVRVRTLLMLALEILHTGGGEADVSEGFRKCLEFRKRQPFQEAGASWANLALLRRFPLKQALTISVAAILASLAGVGLATGVVGHNFSSFTCAARCIIISLGDIDFVSIEQTAILIKILDVKCVGPVIAASLNSLPELLRPP